MTGAGRIISVVSFVFTSLICRHIYVGVTGQGGVHIANLSKVKELAPKMLGGTLVTKQSGPAGAHSACRFHVGQGLSMSYAYLQENL